MTSLRHLPRDALRYVRNLFAFPSRAARSEALLKGLQGRTMTLETVALPYLAEIRRGLLISMADVLAHDPAVKVSLLPVEAPYPVFNPGMVDTEDGFLMVARCSSLVNHREGHYVCERPPQITRSYLLRLDAAGRLMEQVELEEGAPPAGSRWGNIEDMRLFWWQGRLMGMAAVVQEQPDGSLHVMQGLVEIQGRRIVPDALAPVTTQPPMEKNWAPLIHDGRLLFAYSIKPPVFVGYSEGHFAMPPPEQMQECRFDLRGGTPFVPWGDGYLALVHSPPQWWDGRIHYIHHFVVLDRNLQLIEVSPGFFLVRKGIEFASGLVRRGNELVVSVGLADRHCGLVILPMHLVNRFVLTRPATPNGSTT